PERDHLIDIGRRRRCDAIGCVSAGAWEDEGNGDGANRRKVLEGWHVPATEDARCHRAVAAEHREEDGSVTAPHLLECRSHPFRERVTDSEPAPERMHLEIAGIERCLLPAMEIRAPFSRHRGANDLSVELGDADAPAAPLETIELKEVRLAR